jgi:FkbM family methyltransferase
MSLTEKLVKSIELFSEAKIIVYGVNCEVPFDYKCLIKRTLNPPPQSIHDRWYWKQYACIESLNEDFENFIWIDGDVVVNHNIDDITKYFSAIENYPLSDIHRNEEFFANYWVNNELYIQSFNQRLSELYNVNKTHPYMHVCMYIYNKNCKWWFDEILSVYKNIDINQYNHFLTWNDEGIDNFLRWKYNYKKHLPMSNFDTSGYDSDVGSTNKGISHFYDFWTKKGPFNFNKIYGFQYIPKNKKDVLYFHGNKNLKYADDMIDFINHQKHNTFYKSDMFFTEPDVVKNFKYIRGIHGGTVEVAHKYGWDHAIYHEIFNLEDYYLNHNKVINDGDIVVDLGANIGIFNRWAYSQGADKVISFEPDKRYFNLLKLNVDPRTFLFNASMSDSIGEVKLCESEHLGGSTILTTLNLNVSYTTRTYTLDYLFDSNLINHINFLKVDVEGAEQLVFRGLSNKNLKKINYIAMEYHHGMFKYDEQLRSQLIHRINSQGFSSYILHLGTDNNLQYIYFKNENTR